MFLFEEVQNPLLPSGFDVVWTIFAVGAALVFIVAFVTLIRKRKLFSLTASMLWFLAILFVPILGSLLLLLLTRGMRTDEVN